MPRAGALLLFLLLSLAACGLDDEQADLCEALLPAMEAPGERYRVLERRTVPEEAGLVEIRYLRGRPGVPAWLRCRFGGAAGSAERLSLDAVEGDEVGVLSESDLYFLRRFWLEPFAGGAGAAARAADEARAGAGPAGLRYFAQQLLNALPVSGIYALLAVGFMLIHGQLQRFNLAFGELATASAYALLLSLALPPGGWTEGLPGLLLVAAGTLATGALFGLGSHRLVFRRLVDAPGQGLLIAGLGLAIALREGIRLLQGSRERWLPDVLPGRISLLDGGFPLVVSDSALAAGLWCLACAIALLLFMARSRYGRAYRASADDPLMAALCGQDPDRVRQGAFLLGGLAAGAAALAMGLHYGGIDAYGGFLLGLKAAVAAILGGLGSVGGALLGGLLLGLFETFWSGYLSAGSRDIAVFGLLALLLAFRPQGLLGRRELAEAPGPGARRDASA